MGFKECKKMSLMMPLKTPTKEVTEKREKVKGSKQRMNKILRLMMINKTPLELMLLLLLLQKELGKGVKKMMAV